MKKKLILFLVCSAYIALSLQTAIAQSWNITGNNNTTALSKLGTTNLIPLNLYTNNVERVRIDEAGRVGIGTSTPINILTVKSTAGTPVGTWQDGLTSPVFVAFSENASSESVLAAASNIPLRRPVLQGRRARGTLAAPAIVQANDYLSSFLASGFDGNTFQNPATIDFFVDGAASAGNVPARISFVTGSNQGNRAERLKVGSTGNFDFNAGQITLTQSSGNVGIGTGDLIFSNSFQTVQFPNPGASSSAMINIYASGTTNNNRMVIAHSPGFQSYGLQYRDNGDVFDFLSAGSSVLSVGLGSGNVGVGIAAPARKLHVFNGSAGGVTPNANSPFVVENSTANFISVLAPAASEKGILFGDNANAQDGGVIYNGSANSLQFRTNGNVTRMTLSSVGNLDIAGGNLSFGSVETFADAGANTISSNSDLVPSADGTNSLGTAAFTWFDVWATDPTINTSDARLKENVENLTYGLDEILKLRPVTYNWIKFKDDGKKIGLIAQEVQKVIPEMVIDSRIVRDEETGVATRVPTPKMGITYDALIPVLVKAIQEQDTKMKEYEARIDQLTKMVETLANNNGGLSIRPVKGFLSQNTPNPPVANSTRISYSLPEGVNRAELIINDIAGRKIKQIRLNNSGDSYVNVSTSLLSKGTYTYSLFVNGVLADTKKMVIANNNY